METFAVWSGTLPSGEVGVIGISETSDMKPSDYFLPGTKDILRIGELEIDGDLHLLNDYITIH